MAARSFHKPHVIAPGRVILFCTFRPAGTGAPTNLVGKGFSSTGLARTGVGTFDVVLQDKYMELEGHSVSLMANAAGSLVAELASEDVAGTTPKVTVRLVNKSTGAAADLAAHANNRISVVLYLRNTSVA